MWFADGLWYKSMLLVLLIVLSSLSFFPMMLWKILCGKLLGLWGGFALVSLAYVLAIYCTLVLGRSVLQARVRERLKEKPEIWDKILQIEERGPVFILLLRLNPLAHFGLLNYALSLSKIRTLAILFYSWLGATPITLLNLWIGVHAGEIFALKWASQSKYWSLGIGALLLGILYLWLRSLGPKAIKKGDTEVSPLD